MDSQMCSNVTLDTRTSSLAFIFQKLTIFQFCCLPNLTSWVTTPCLLYYLCPHFSISGVPHIPPEQNCSWGSRLQFNQVSCLEIEDPRFSPLSLFSKNWLPSPTDPLCHMHTHTNTADLLQDLHFVRVLSVLSFTAPSKYIFSKTHI